MKCPKCSDSDVRPSRNAVKAMLGGMRCMNCHRRFHGWSTAFRAAAPWMAISALCLIAALAIGRSVSWGSAGTGSVHAAAEGDLVLSIQPHPVVRSEDGAWTYRVQVHETKGVPVRIWKLSVAGVDQSAKVAAWFGTDEIPANGWVMATARSSGSSPATVDWVLEGEAKKWRAAVELR